MHTYDTNGFINVIMLKTTFKYIFKQGAHSAYANFSAAL